MEERVKKNEQDIASLIQRMNTHGHTQFDNTSIIQNGFKMYAGSVASNGTATQLPNGWTSARTGAGAYTVTHNLGTTAYMVVGSAVSLGDYIVSFGTISSTTFLVNTYLTFSAANTDVAFDFIVAVKNFTPKL